MPFHSLDESCALSARNSRSTAFSSTAGARHPKFLSGCKAMACEACRCQPSLTTLAPEMRFVSVLGLALADVNFVSIGDWGDSEAKTYVADVMGTYAADLSAQFVVGIGDNMYDTGVSSVDDPQFADKFEETFTASSLQVPWYVVGGNHDYYGSIEAQVDYTNKSDRWKFPDLYYRQYVEDGGVSLTLVCVDTWRLNGGDTYVKFDPVTRTGVVRDRRLLDRHLADGLVTEGTYSSITRTFPATADVAVQGDQEQLDQIEAWLKDANSTWTVVVGHFPVYSATVGEHGETASLIADLAPLLSKYNVTAYFSGHDHVLQHINRDGVHFLGSGAGARTHSGMNTSYPGLVFASDGMYGFMTHRLTSSTFETTFVVNDGGDPDEPYTFTIAKDS